jgi:hypothetical protein
MLLVFVWSISLWNTVYSHDEVKDLSPNIGVTMPRFNIGAYRRKRKQMEEKQVTNTEKIILIQTKIVEQESVLVKKRKQSHALEEKYKKLDSKVRQQLWI